MTSQTALDNRRRFTELYRTGILCGRGGGSRRRLACAASERAAGRALAWLRARRRRRLWQQRQRQQQEEQQQEEQQQQLPRTPLPVAPDRPAPSPRAGGPAAAASSGEPQACPPHPVPAAAPAARLLLAPLALPDPLVPPRDARATALVAAAAAMATAATNAGGPSERAGAATLGRAWREVAAERARRAASAPCPLAAKRERGPPPPPPQQQQQPPLPKRARRAGAGDDGLRRSSRRPPVEVVVIDDSSSDEEEEEEGGGARGGGPGRDGGGSGGRPGGGGGSSPTIISARDLSTLLPRRWLNDEAINAYFSLIQRRSGGQGSGRRPAAAAGVGSWPPLRVTCFSSFFFTLLTSGRGVERRYDFDAVRRWTMRRCSGGGDSGGDDDGGATTAAAAAPAAPLPRPLVARCHLILAPVHLSGAHWALAAVWPSLGRAEVFDTLADSRKAAAGPSSVARIFARWLEDEARDKGVRLPCARASAKAARHAPAQRDAHSCGALVCAMAERLAAGLPARALEAALGGGGGGGGAAGPAAARLRLGLARELVRGRLEGDGGDDE